MVRFGLKRVIMTQKRDVYLELLGRKEDGSLKRIVSALPQEMKNRAKLLLPWVWYYISWVIESQTFTSSCNG